MNKGFIQIQTWRYRVIFPRFYEQIRPGTIPEGEQDLDSLEAELNRLGAGGYSLIHGTPDRLIFGMPTGARFLIVDLPEAPQVAPGPRVVRVQ